MNKYIYKIGGMFASALVGLVCLTSCNEEPETSLFDPDQLTIAEMISQDSELSAFYRILQKGGFSNYMATYGEYTCFAPFNSGVSTYLDSLYDDESYKLSASKLIHNGIKEAANFHSLSVMDKVELMSDSLCEDLSRFHLSGETHKKAELDGTATTWTTMKIGRTVRVGTYISDDELDGSVVLNDIACIVDGDIEASNGILHKLNKMIPRSDRTTDDQLRVEEDLSAFYIALEATGLKDSLLIEEKKDASGKTLHYDLGANHNDRDGNALYYPKTCMVKWTVFAETNSVLEQAGIKTTGTKAEILESFRQKCSEWYKNCSGWYDYIREKNITVSDGTDYENEWNVVHMFVAYHILRAGMPIDRIVYEKNADTNSSWNFCFGYEPQEYFETLLKNTLLKVWETNPKTTKDLWLNRYMTNNTLTKKIGMFGFPGDGDHVLEFAGVGVDRKRSVETLNGYIHRIKDVLVYNETARKALNERLRLDSSTFLYELINNGLRGATAGEVSTLNNGGDGNRVAFHNTFFDNIVAYNPGTLLRFNVMGAWRAHNSDQFQGWDVYDFAIKLPHVPSGQYELRIIYPPMGRGGLMQFYLGNSPKQSDMVAIGIPFDACANPYETPSIGYTDVVIPEDEEEKSVFDYGVETDQQMKIRGYMRAPASFSRGSYNTITDRLNYVDNDPYSAARQMIEGGTSTSCRTEQGYGTMMLRRIITTQQFDQSKDYWLRIKNLVNDANLGWSFDFVELVPIHVVNSQDMTEDWY